MESYWFSVSKTLIFHLERQKLMVKVSKYFSVHIKPFGTNGKLIVCRWPNTLGCNSYTVFLSRRFLCESWLVVDIFAVRERDHSTNGK